MSLISMTVNGKAVSAEVEDRTLLVQLLRDHLNLTGTHVGCDTSQCGACTVLLDGVAVKSCSVLAVQAAGRSVTTVEGLATNGVLHPVQDAFIATLGPAGGWKVGVKDDAGEPNCAPLPATALGSWCLTACHVVAP